MWYDRRQPVTVKSYDRRQPATVKSGKYDQQHQAIAKSSYIQWQQSPTICSESDIQIRQMA